MIVSSSMKCLTRSVSLESSSRHPDSLASPVTMWLHGIPSYCVMIVWIHNKSFCLGFCAFNEFLNIHGNPGEVFWNVIERHIKDVTLKKGDWMITCSHWCWHHNWAHKGGGVSGKHHGSSLLSNHVNQPTGCVNDFYFNKPFKFKARLAGECLYVDENRKWGGDKVCSVVSFSGCRLSGPWFKSCLRPGPHLDSFFSSCLFPVWGFPYSSSQFIIHPVNGACTVACVMK